MRRILQPIRVFMILTSIFFFLIHMGVVWLLVRSRWPRIRWANRILSYYCRFGLWVLKVRVHPIGFESAMAHRNALFVGNHLSYIDVLVFSSLRPACFVTSVEVKETPGLGTICQMAGCLFVERRNKANLLNEVEELTEGLRHDLNVAIFPEATSTNGEQILRFRRPLYVAAIQSGKPVIPFCLNYHTVGGEPINRRSRDSIFWYGDMDFLPHLWALAGAGGVDVDLHFLPAVLAEKETDSTKLAELTQSMVAAVFRPVVH